MFQPVVDEPAVDVPLGCMFEENGLSLRRPLTYQQQNEIGFQPRKDCIPWPFKLPVDWGADPFNDQNWQFQFQALRMIDPMLIEYFDTGSEPVLQEAVALCLDWWRSLGPSPRNRYEWGDRATGVRATKIPFIYERATAKALALSASELQQLETMIDAHAVRLLSEDTYRMNNHSFFQAAGLMHLAKAAAQRPSLEGAKAFANRKMRELLAMQFTNEGVHTEHSPSYHLFVLQLCKQMRIATFFDDPSVVDLASRAEKVMPWLIHPDGKIARIGDSNGVSKPYDGSQVIGDFTASGYAVARSANWMIIMMGMVRGKTHKHADELSFELFDGGHIFCDTGKYGYATDDWRSYITSAAAHNTVGVLDREIGLRSARATGSCLSRIDHVDGVVRIEGAVKRPGLFRQSRQLRYIPHQRLEIIDRLKSEERWHYTSNLHLAPHLKPTITTNGFEVDLPDGRKMIATSNAQKVEHHCDSKDPRLGWCSAGYLKMKPTSTIRAIRSGSDTRITWSIEFRSN